MILEVSGIACAYDGADVLFQAPSHVARFLPPDLWQ